MKSLRTLLANVKVVEVEVKGEEKMDARELVLGAKFESGVAKANAVIGDVIAEMCGDALAMEEAMEKALVEKEERRARRAVKIAKAVKMPVNKRAEGIVTPKAPQNVKADKDMALVEARIEKFLNVCNGVANFFNIGRLAESKNAIKMNLQMLASGSASTSTNNNNGGDVEMKDLTNVKNADVVIQKKWSVISNKKKGQMLGLVIRMDKKKRVGVTEIITNLPENKFTRHLEGVCGTTTIGNRVYTFKEENRFVDEFITVSFDAACSQLFSEQDFYIDIKRGIVALPKVNENFETCYTDIRTGKVVNTKDLVKYRLALATAAGLRGKDQLFNAIFAKLENNETIASKVLNPHLHNIIKHANSDMNKDKAAKFMSRPGLAWTGSKAVASVNCLAYYNGVFDSESARNTFDGVGFASAKYIANVFNITEEDACKLSLQSRPGGVIKIQLKVLPTKLFNLYVKYLETKKDAKGNSNLTIHGNGEVEFIYDNNSIKANIDVTDIKLEVLAIGRTSEVALSKQMIEKLFLEAARIDRANGNTETTESVKTFITTLGKDRIKEVFAELFNNDGVVSPDVEYIYDIINKVGKNNIPAARKSSMTNALRTIAKLIDKLSFTDGNMFYSVIYTDTAQLFGYEIIREGEIFYPKMRNVDGNKGIMFKYPSMGGREFYSFETVSFDTICKRLNTLDMNDDLRKALKEEYKRASKSLVILPASRKVFDSCAGMDIDMDAAALVFTDLVVDLLHGKEEYVKLDSTSVVEQSKHKVSATMKNEAKDAVNDILGSLSGGSEKQTFADMVLSSDEFNPQKDEFYAKMFAMATGGATKSVGEITFDNNRAISVAIEAFKGNFAPIDAIIKENAGIVRNMTNSYNGLPVDDDSNIQLSEATIKAMIKEMKNMELDSENRLAMALDLSRCFRLYQETIIDAAKTGVKVDIDVTVKSVELKSLQKVKFVEERMENGPVNLKIKRLEKELKSVTIYVDGKKQTVMPILIEDDMSRIQDELIDFTMAVKEQLEAKSAMYDFVGESSKVKGGSMKELIMGSLDRFTKNNPEGRLALEEMKSIYGVIAMEYNNAMNLLEEEDRSEEEKAALKDQFNEKLAYLCNSTERILAKVCGSTDKGTLMTRGAILMAIAALTKAGTVSANSSNKFAFNIAPHYALAYALADTKYENTCTVLHCDDNVEGEVKVKHGFSADNSLILSDNFKNRENGEATVNVERLEDGTVKVTEVKHIEVPEVDASKSSLILDATIAPIFNENGERVVDASGNEKIQATCEVGAIFNSLEFETFMFKRDEVITFVCVTENGKKALTIPAGKVKFNDMEENVRYDVNLGYLVAARGGRAVIELSKHNA